LSEYFPQISEIGETVSLNFDKLDYVNLRDGRTLAKAFLVAASAFTTVSFIIKCYKTHRLRKALSNIHNRPHPLYGNLHEHPGSGPETFNYTMKHTAIAKTMYQFWFGPFLPTIFLVHPDTAKVIFKSSEPK